MLDPAMFCLVAGISALLVVVGGIAVGAWQLLTNVFFYFLCFLLISGILLSVYYTIVFFVGYFTAKDEESSAENTQLNGKGVVKETGFQTVTPVTGWNMEYFQMVFLLLVTFGSQTVVYTTNKIMFQLSSASTDESAKPFQKPLFVTMCSYIGLVLYIPFSGLRPEKFDGNRAILVDVFITAVYGAIAMISLFCALALLPVSSTIMPMVGGTTIFTIIFSYYAGRTPLDVPIVLSICVIIVGTGLVMVPSIVDSVVQIQTKDAPIIKSLEGILFMISNMVFSGLKNVNEELVFSKTKRLNAANFAGLYCLFCVDVLLVVLVFAQFTPGPDNGLQEDSIQTAEMLANFPNRELAAALLLVAIAARTVWHVMNKTLTQYYGASTNVIVQSVTMFLSWIVAVILYYACWDSGLGEPFDLVDAIFKAIGGVLILIGNDQYLRNRRAADDKLGPKKKDEA